MAYPEFCLRGLREKDHFNEIDNTITMKGYLPDTRTAKVREDKGFATSINWEDNGKVAKDTLKLEENGKPCFPFGIVRLPLLEIERIKNNPATKDMLSYERAKLPYNKHHGNIVFLEGLLQLKQNMIASVLAAYSSKVIHRINND